MDKLFKLNKLGFRLKIFKRDSKFVVTATSKDKIIEHSSDVLDDAIEECYDACIDFLDSLR